MACAPGYSCLEASDLGIELQSPMFVELVEELGTAPPWPIAALQALFDRRYPGWDDSPMLSVSSPVSRLRGLAEALSSNDSTGIQEALRELAQEVKHAQIRTMCRQADTSPLTDECSFLLLLLGELGRRHLMESQAWHLDHQRANLSLQEAESARRAAFQEGQADAQAEAKQSMEDLSAEAEIQHQRADKLQQQIEVLELEVRKRTDLEEELQTLHVENRSLLLQLETTRDELRDAKLQRAALAVAHEESEGFVHELSRRLEQQDAAKRSLADSKDEKEASEKETKPQVTKSTIDPAKSSEDGSLTYKGGHIHTVQKNRNAVFDQGAKAALTILSASVDSPLRPIFLAWRCARLEAKFFRISAAAAAESLQADLSLAGASCLQEADAAACGQEGCCCMRSMSGLKCCRIVQRDIALEALQELRAGVELDKIREAQKVTVTPLRYHCWFSSNSILWLRALIVACVIQFGVFIQIEPHLSHSC